VNDFAGTFQNLDFDKDAAQHYGEIRADLEKNGNIIGPNDLMISAIARSKDLVLITNNIGKFKRVKNLKNREFDSLVIPFTFPVGCVAAVIAGGEEKIMDAGCWMTKKKLLLDSGRWSLDSLFREF
jgi:hypothetical protein